MSTSPPTNDLAEAMQVGHALNMLAELPPLTDDSSLPVAANVACLESFFINLRLMFEFLVARPKKGRIHRSAYLSGWKPPEGGALEQLRRDYGLASEQVAHLAKTRVVRPGESFINVLPEALSVTTAAVLDVMAEFVKALQSAGSPSAPTFAGFLAVAQRRR